MIGRDAHYTIIPRTSRAPTYETVAKQREDLYSFRSLQPPRQSPNRSVGYVWSSLHCIWFACITADLIRASWTPMVEWTGFEPVEFSPLELMAANLLLKGKITEGYVVDLFAQVAIFEENEVQFELEYKGKELAICGGRLFVGTTMEEALAEAQSQFPGRPYYAVSLVSSPVAM